MDRKKEFLLRVYLVMAGFILLALIMFGRAIQISYLQGNKWKQREAIFWLMMEVHWRFPYRSLKSGWIHVQRVWMQKHLIRMLVH